MIKFTKYGDEIELSKPKILIQNIILGSMSFDMEGPSIGKNYATGDSIELMFHTKKWNQPPKIVGKVKNA